MLRCKTLVLTLCLVALSSLAQASTLLYQPAAVALTIPAGGQEQVQIKVNVDVPRGSAYYLWYLDTIANGNLPAFWLTSAPVRSFVFGGSAGTATVTVSVPPGTPAGTYRAQVLARGMSTHDQPAKGAGILLEVTVPSRCSGVPQITLAEIAPRVIWPPNNSLTQVIISGTVVAPEGCTLAEVGYSLEDEYQLLSSMGTIEIAGNGSFTLAVPVEAMRRGQDKDGRSYHLTVYARDEAGLAATVAEEITVPHDRRD